MIPDGEQLARFVFSSGHVRNNGGVKYQAFMPPASLELSVTRHAALAPSQVWERGESVAVRSERRLVGRADILTGAVRGEGLEAQEDAIAENPEHTVIVGWPAEKSHQMNKAQALARDAQYLARPQ